MTDARIKYVYDSLISIYERTEYAIDAMHNLREPLMKGESIDVPYLSAFTVVADGTTQTSPTEPTTNVATLTANKHPWINVKAPVLAMVQNMGGSWADEVSKEALAALKNKMDEDLLGEYLAQSLCWVTGAVNTYHVNVEGDDLTEDDILLAQAHLEGTDGVRPENLALFVSSYGAGAIASIAGFVPNGQAAEKGFLGMPRIGTVFGIPVYKTSGVKRNLTATATASAVSSGTFTITVPSGHGFVAGMPITTAGGTYDVDASTAITSTTSTSITVSYGSATDAANGALVVSSNIADTAIGTSMNVMVDRNAIFVAQQKMPEVREVADYKSTDSALQFSCLWGRIGIAGRAYCIHSPGSKVTW